MANTYDSANQPRNPEGQGPASQEAHAQPDVQPADLTLPPGFRAAGTYAGIKAPGRGFDLGVLVADEARPAAAIYTKNLLLGAHVPVCRDHLARSGGLVRAIVANSGNANCATGGDGEADARIVAEAAGRIVGCPTEQVLVLSTGVIGKRLPVGKITEAIPELFERAAPDLGVEFARAIMTTDTVPKYATDGARTGFAKGSGMIHPDMATMLSVLLQGAGTGGSGQGGPTVEDVTRVADRSFHRLSVDGDPSPNDTVVLWGHGPTDVDAWTPLCQHLARVIARDGEGATRLVTIVVRGAPSEKAAVAVGRTIATSPLTKTAITGRDPNWGRILSAAARAGVPFDPRTARVWIGPGTVYDNGVPYPQNEPAAHEHMRDRGSVEVGVDLRAGDASAEVWTCDLTIDYVRINADYRS